MDQPISLSTTVINKRRLLVQVLCGVLLMSSCSDPKPQITTLQLKSPATGETKMRLKSSYALGKTLQLGSGGTVAMHDVYMANYPLEQQSYPPGFNQPKNDGEMLVSFSLTGSVGSAAMSPSIGTYAVKPEFGPGSDPVMRIASVTITSRQNGVENRNFLVTGALAGTITIKSIMGTMILGEMNFTAGDTTLSGPFNSWLLERKY